jgi:mono/diheme cytochrome c family protein
MVIVFVRAPVANTHITDPDGYDRTIVNYLDVSYPYEGFGLNDESVAQSGDPIVDGSLLYFQYACGACHGLVGQGAVVGPALVDELGSFGSFAEDVRDGPGGMPSYSVSTISDEILEKIYGYLKDGG